MITGKFIVERADGKPSRKDARFFVVDYASDPYARIAMRSYADACEDTHPMLATSLRQAADMHDERDSARRATATRPVRGTQGAGMQPTTNESLLEVVKRHLDDPEFASLLAAEISAAPNS